MVEAGALVKELQQMRDDGHLSDALLRFAVRSIEPSDDRYAWVGVYRHDDDGEDVWLHNYLGAGTDHARIPLGTGICGKAVANKANMVVADVSKEEEESLVSAEDILSEMVVLIRAGDDVFGLIKVESEEEGAFTDEDDATIQLVAEKLAEQMMAERR